MINKIYLDMDGVLANFEKRYEELFNEKPSSSRELKNFSSNWTEFVEGKHFVTLDMFPGANELLKFVDSTGIEVEILSSSGGEKYHYQVAAQKSLWLMSKGLWYKRNIVSGRSKKKNFATPNSILIDDTEDVIESFIEAGGLGILHRDAGKTIEILEKVLAI